MSTLLNPRLMESLRAQVQTLPPRIHLLTNRRKVLLTGIYNNLIRQLKHRSQVVVLDVNDLSPGFLTNPLNSTFIQPDHVVVLLTKNHHARELKILEELGQVRVRYTLISLGIDYKVDPGNKKYYVKDVKALYLFMYNLTHLHQVCTYHEFSKNYSWWQ